VALRFCRPATREQIGAEAPGEKGKGGLKKAMAKKRGRKGDGLIQDDVGRLAAICGAVRGKRTECNREKAGGGEKGGRGLLVKGVFFIRG